MNKKVQLTERQYENKSAYRIDPIMASKVEIVKPKVFEGNVRVVDLYIKERRKERLAVFFLLIFLGFLIVYFGKVFADQPKKELAPVYTVSPTVFATVAPTTTTNEISTSSTSSTTTSTTTTLPAHKIHFYPDVERWYPLAIKVGWLPEDWPVLSCVMYKESRGQDGVKNPNSSATGLLQIIAGHHKGVNLYDPETNLSVGLRMYNARGWQPWETTVGGCQ